MTTPAWLLACSKEAEKGFDPNIKSYHMGWSAAMNSANAEIFAIRQSLFDLVTERDALKAELSCLRNQGAELAALKKELEALRNQQPMFIIDCNGKTLWVSQIKEVHLQHPDAGAKEKPE